MVRRTPPAHSPTDWEAVRRKLSDAGEQIHQPVRHTPEEIERILRERAEQLSAAPPGDDDPADWIDAVRFTLGTNTLFLGLDYLQEVAVRITPLPIPVSPPLLLGLMNLRGNILPVFDLSQILNWDGIPLQSSGSVLVCGKQSPEFALLVDHVQDVEAIALKLLREPPHSLPASTRGLLLGVTPGMGLVIDGETLLTDSRLFIEQEETP